MAVYSMTGWASVQKVGTNASEDVRFGARRAVRIGLEIRSVNSRFLDLAFRLPDALRAHEAALRQLLGEHCKRGKVELRVAISDASDGALAIIGPTWQQLQQLAAVQATVRDCLPNAAELSVADALRLCQPRADEASVQSIDAKELTALARDAVRQLLEARASEGARLAQVLLGNVAQLRRLASEAEPLLPTLVAQARQRFLDRWRDALSQAEQGGTLPEAAQDRALAEATAFALRIDVAEELARLGSHLDEIERLLARGGEVGKRLEFLIQELQREANTLGSKSAALELSRIAVDMKVLIEQMREQVQNLE